MVRAWQNDCYAVGLEGWIDTPTKGMSLEDYLIYRQENAAPASVDWEQLARDLILNKDVLAGKEAAIKYDAGN